MLTQKQNFLETLKRDGKPDRLPNQYHPIKLIMNDPLGQYTRGMRKRGTDFVDRWGTTFTWPEDQVACTPHITQANKVCKDITCWRDYVKVPDIVATCGDSALWEDTRKFMETIDRDEYLVGAFLGNGVFEQMHFLSGFEDTLSDMLLEPEASIELAEAIGEYRYQYAKLVVENLHPDIAHSLDDWGTKYSMFMSPDTWRQIIKPQYAKMYKYLKEQGVIIVHHSDSFLEPIVEDMVELGIDVWQGVLPTNDIPRLIKQLDGRMVLMGGIDSIVDREDATEEEIRAEARRACEEYSGAGHFIPCLTYGSPASVYPHVYDILSDEIDRFNKERFGA
ncbi:MAG: uroporphyrinogen decarboxylase (URO-D) [Oscillospiraceae bacterium]|nr:uroporphyrinogen decarboxylase (URO-D) [Oscillospiraceae bacterium]